MAPSTCRRSASVRATMGDRTPTPRSKPSSATYIASISAAIANHSSTMCGLCTSVAAGRERPGAVSDLTRDQEEEENAEHQIEPAEPDEGEEHGSRVNGGTAALAGPVEAVHEPGLTAELGGHPADGVCDIRERKREHEDPQHRPTPVEPVTPEERHGDESNYRENGAEAHHDVEGVIQELDVVGPDVWWERVEAANVGMDRPEGEERERPRDDDRIVQAALGHIRLTDQHEPGT